MPSRIIREGILSSERVDALSLGAEVFYRRLLSIVDDYGRFTANLTLLRTSCYPLRVDKVKEPEIDGYLSECVDAGLIKHYTVNGKAFLEVQDFKQQIRAKESKYPSPDDGLLIERKANDCQPLSDAKQMLTDVHLDVFGDVFGDGSGGESDRSTKANASPTPAALLSIAMRECGIDSQPGDPRVITLAEQGVSVETVKAACDEARRQKPDERISAGFIASIVQRWAKQASSIQAGGAKAPAQQAPPWWSSNELIEAKAKEVGCWPARGNESWTEWRARIETKIRELREVKTA